MAPSEQAPYRRRGDARLSRFGGILYTTLCLLLFNISASAAAAVRLAPRETSHASPESSPLVRRIEGEHVILADCTNGANSFSSQMAYYVADPGPTPVDVAVVPTSPNQYALWINANTSALFTTTGVTFSAVLGPRVDDGQYAGTGNNGYGNFTCYQRYVHDLYTWNGAKCSQVYECDHSEPPGEFTLSLTCKTWLI
jgi:hypothetical protein